MKQSANMLPRSFPERDSLQGPRDVGRRPSWKYRELFQLGEVALPSREGSADGDGVFVCVCGGGVQWQVPDRQVPKGTASGATSCVSRHVGAGVQPGRPGAASLPRVPLSWRCPTALFLETLVRLYTQDHSPLAVWLQTPGMLTRAHQDYLAGILESFSSLTPKQDAG